MVRYTSSPKHSLPSSLKKKNQHSLSQQRDCLNKFIFSTFQNILDSDFKKKTTTKNRKCIHPSHPPPPSKNSLARCPVAMPAASYYNLGGWGHVLWHTLSLESRSVGQHFKDKAKDQVAALRGKIRNLNLKHWF